MKQEFILFLKGVLIGVGKMLPGVSGGMIAMMLNVYEKGLSAIAHLRKDLKTNLHFLFFIGIGIFLAMVLSSKVILNLLKNYYLPTILFFIGLMLGGIPSVVKTMKKTKKGLFLAFLSFFLMMLLPLFTSNDTVQTSGIKGSFMLIMVGIIDAGTMVIPGISGTAILMILGYYPFIIGAVSNLTSISSFFLQLPILLPFGIGLGVGIFFFVKLMDHLFERHINGMYSLILGLASSSIVLLFLNTFQNNYSFTTIILGLLLLVMGIFLSSFLEKIS